MLLPSLFVSAQTCGDFISTYDYGDGPVEERDPVSDCSNPFNINQGPQQSTVTITLDGTVFSGGQVAVDTMPIDLAVAIDVNVNPYDYSINTSLLRHEGDDFRYIQESVDSTLSFSATGTYSLLTQVTELPQLMVENPWWQRIQNIFFPIAYAQSSGVPFEERFVTTFTVELTEPELLGASSVLFLPGIQASRLYTQEGGGENRLWEPNRDKDVEKLTMNESGESVGDIYTNDVLAEIFGVSNVYKSFLDLLEDLKGDDSIKDYLPFAYDWRYDVFTVATEPVKYPYGETKVLLDEVKRLAAESHTGKVTIVAHSNGGLVAKALMTEYQNTELVGLVDKVIMVGTPQLGTPAAIGSLLHGLGQSKLFEFLVTQNTARKTTQFMPGAYGLLPSKTYFENFAVDIITSDGSAIASPVSSYGDLSNYENFINFLIDRSNTRNLVTDVTQPVTLSSILLTKTTNQQAILDSWVAPEEVQVFEVAGTGLKTIESFYYREFSCQDSNPYCILVPFVKPMPRFTAEGDRTVVLSSASAYEKDKIKYVVNLKEEGEQFLVKAKNHGNITESDAVEAFLESALLFPQLTDTLNNKEFSSTAQTATIIGIHSPVSIIVRNSSGEEVGVVGGEIKEEINGSSYFEFAGSKYVIIPNNEEIEVLLSGEADGRYSLTIEELNPAGEQKLVQEVIGATSTKGMLASFGCDDGVCGGLTVDYENDGKIDVKFDWLGSYEVLSQQVVLTEESVDGGSSGGSTSGTRVRQPSNHVGQVAGISTSVSDEELKRMWGQLLETKKLLDELEIIINKKYGY